MSQQRPAPPVTISGGPAPAVQQVLPDTEREPRPARPRRRTPVVLAGLAVVAALGIAEVRERAAADEEAEAEAERRLRAVQLVLTTEASGSTSYDGTTDSVTFLVLLRVRNDGQRTVRITSVDIPGIQLLAPATVAVGRERGLTLRGQRSCADDLVQLLERDRLPLEVSTDFGPQSVDLDLGGPLLYGDAIRRACGLTRPGLS